MKIRQLDLEPSPEQAEHGALSLPPLEQPVTHPGPHPFRRDLILLLALPMSVLLLAWLGQRLLPPPAHPALSALLAGLSSEMFLAAALVGLGAQIIDGALGMAYGITATTFLLGTGASPAVASASVHLAEVFTTGFSGLAHWRMGNVNKRLFLSLLLPGAIGIVLGAYVITSIDGNAIKPYVAGYLLLMGLYILVKGLRHRAQHRHEPPRHVASLALTGGFVDAAGGGGWGPVVTSSLVGTGQDPRTTIGSVNAAEFFLTLLGAATFSLLGAFTHWQVIAGLVVGGLFAAPFAAWLTHKLPARTLMLLVGVLISGLSLINLVRALH